MAAHMMAAGLEIESAPPVSPSMPPQAKTKDNTINDIPLEEYEYFNSQPDQSSGFAITPAGAQTPYEARTPGLYGAQTPKTPNELEMSRPPSPKQAEAVSIVPSWSYPKMNKWRVLAACLVYFGNGLNDSAPGALIPYIEKDYKIGYAIVSLIFVTNAVGFIAMAFLTNILQEKLGRAKALMLAEVMNIAAYIIISTTPPFGAVVFAYFFLGFAEALNLALNNVFCGTLANSTVILGAGHGAYGIGGIVGPIIATALVSHGVVWSRFYLIALGIRLCCLASVGWAFWNYENEGTTQFGNNLELIASRQRAEETGQPSKRQLMGRALRNRVTIMGALFIFAYQGAEVNISGWVISYLISYRGGDPAHVGYVTAGFWGGITLGRFALSHLAHRIGEKKFTYFLIAGSCAFQLLVWFIPNVIGDAVAVSILGFLLGPVYPCAQTVFTRSLPSNIMMTGISFIGSAGSSGGAIGPLMTGLLAQAVSTYVLNPINVALFVVMAACWFGLPTVHKRSE